MSVFGDPFIITLPAASTTEVTGTMPTGTNAIMVVCSHASETNFNYVTLSVGFATGTSNQMRAGCNFAYRTVSAGQQGQHFWSNTLIGMGSQGASSSAADVSVSTWSGTTLGLTKNAISAVDVICTVYPIIASSTPDLREITTLNTSGTTATVTGLAFQPKALIYISGGLTSNGSIAGAHINIGMSTGVGQEWAVSIATTSNVNPNDAISIVRTDRFGLMYDGNSTVTPRAGTFTVSAIASDGYTITQSGTTGANKIAVLAIPGNFALLTGDVKATTGTEATTGAGFTPSSGLFILAAFATASNSTAQSQSLSIGGGTLSAQRVTALENVDNVSIPNPTIVAASGNVLMGRTAGAQTSAADISSFDSDGFTLDWTDADATAGLWAALVSEEAAPTAPGFRSYYNHR